VIFIEYNRGGLARLFCLRAKFFSKLVWRAAKKLIFSFLSQNYANLRCFLKMYVQQIWQCINLQSNTLGPQKTFGGPHAARGSQFGHLWNIIIKCHIIIYSQTLANDHLSITTTISESHFQVI
jgi:hypothetical protein